MAAPNFSTATIELLGYRAALICSNPNCRKLTVGPSKVENPLKLLNGEAAHICSAKPGTKKNLQARYDLNMTDAQRADPENGIWLCAGCHTLVDKNSGADFTTSELRQWKADHEAAIHALLMSQKSPFSYLRQYAIEGQIAQDIVNMLESKGVLFQHKIHEVEEYMIASVIAIRASLNLFVPQIKHDQPLQKLVKDLNREFANVMNVTGNFSKDWLAELQTLRNRVAVFLKIMVNDYGCSVNGPLASIL